MTNDAPLWADRVPRWQQMDHVARAVADAWFARFGFGEDVQLGQLVLALPAASNDADVDFAASGAFSPQKFVATLPSVAAAPVLQLSGRVVPVVCIQDGPNTEPAARAEAGLLARVSGEPVMLMTVRRDLRVRFEEVGP